MSRVPMLDPTRADAELLAELEEAFRRLLRSGRYVLGPEVEAFERECAARIGAAHAIGVSSGTDALLAALMALGVGPGDEVVCPTFTFFATAGAIRRLGAKPVFVDCALDDFLAPPEAFAAAITTRTKAIVPVHLFGQCADMDAILALAAERRVAVVEDAAQAMGASADASGARGAGTMGAFGCFSFFPSKNVGGFGDGGLVATSDPERAEAVRVLRAQGAKPKYHHATVGGNFRLDALQAALLRPKLRRLDASLARRRANAAAYCELFAATGIGAPNDGAAAEAPVLWPVERRGMHSYNQFVVRVPGGRRDALRAHLHAHGIDTEVYYPVPMHLQPCFSSLGHREGDLPASERAAREALALPIFPELRHDEIARVVDAIARFFARAARLAKGAGP